MPSTLKKVRPGDPLEIPAAAFNTFIDVARAHLARQHARGRDAWRAFQQTGIVLVKNASGSDVGQYGVLGIDGPIITAADNEDEFRTRVALKGVTPSESDHVGRFVILLEPVADGQIGRGVAAGVTVARVSVDSEHADDSFADISDGSTTALALTSRGSAQVLWREAGDSGTKWAVVRLGREPAPTGLGQFLAADLWFYVTGNQDWTDVDTRNWSESIIAVCAWWNGGGPPGMGGSWNEDDIEIADFADWTWQAQEHGKLLQTHVPMNEFWDIEILRWLRSDFYGDFYLRVNGTSGALQAKSANFGNHYQIRAFLLCSGRNDATQYIQLG